MRVEPGVIYGELDRETQLFGLATTGGTVSLTGIAGLTLGGGLGWLARKHGLACDTLLSVDLISAEGAFLTASATQNPDLFWGVRGGGNFGVVTSFEYQRYPLGTVLGGLLYYPIDQAREALRFYRDLTLAAPDELTVDASLGPHPGWRAERHAHLLLLRRVRGRGAAPEAAAAVRVAAPGPRRADALHPDADRNQRRGAAGDL